MYLRKFKIENGDELTAIVNLMEDTLATASSFGAGGEAVFRADPGRRRSGPMKGLKR